MIYRIVISLLLITVVSIALLLSCNNKTVEKDNGVITESTIPPIDSSIPTRIETATFALG